MFPTLTSKALKALALASLFGGASLATAGGGATLGAVVLAGGLGFVGTSTNAEAADPRRGFRTADEAYERGISDYRSGRHTQAIDALEYAAARGSFLAQYYLARAYADSMTPHTDHGKAYMLYRRLADEYADVDPDDDRRAPFVAKSITALARYLREGLPEIGLKPSPDRAIGYLRHAATFFNEEDAQFELARIQLERVRAGGVQPDIASDTKRALHWLSVLTQRGHPGAQAFLADLYWRGLKVKGAEIIRPDAVRALGLIEVARENAAPRDLIWIDEIHHNIFCGANTGTRSEVAGFVAEWQKRYGRPAGSGDLDAFGLGALGRPERTCSNGEAVRSLERSMADRPAAAPTADPRATGSIQAGAAGGLTLPTGALGLRDVGAQKP